MDRNQVHGTDLRLDGMPLGIIVIAIKAFPDIEVRLTSCISSIIFV